LTGSRHEVSVTLLSQVFPRADAALDPFSSTLCFLFSHFSYALRLSVSPGGSRREAVLSPGASHFRSFLLSSSTVLDPPRKEFFLLSVIREVLTVYPLQNAFDFLNSCALLWWTRAGLSSFGLFSPSLRQFLKMLRGDGSLVGSRFFRRSWLSGVQGGVREYH